MKNKAKCRLCSGIIESLHNTDYVMCACGEIAVDGGDALLCYCKDWGNFMRVDDEGNEIIVKVESSTTDKTSQPANTGAINNNKSDPGDINQSHSSKPNKKQLLEMLTEMIKTIDGLPQHAMSNPINHYDYSSLLILLLAFFTDDCNSDS